MINILLLPSSKYKFKDFQKIDTYLYLNKIGCPVLKSILIQNPTELTYNKIEKMKQYFESEYCTLRYQYIRSNKSPIQGGNKIKLDCDLLKSKIVDDTLMWLLRPIDRLENKYGINMFFDLSHSLLIFECVGRGFDVSDLNRGHMNPHQVVKLNLPIEYGWYNEWWKFIEISIISKTLFNQSKSLRIN